MIHMIFLEQLGHEVEVSKQGKNWSLTISKHGDSFIYSKMVSQSKSTFRIVTASSYTPEAAPPLSWVTWGVHVGKVQMVLVACEMIGACYPGSCPWLGSSYHTLCTQQTSNHINQWHWLICGCWDFAFYEKNHPLGDIRSSINRIGNY